MNHSKPILNNLLNKQISAKYPIVSIQLYSLEYTCNAQAYSEDLLLHTAIVQRVVGQFRVVKVGVKMPKSIDISIHLDYSYIEFFNKLKGHITKGRIRAAMALNKEVIQMYWQMGRDLIEKENATNWGDKLIIQVSHDLQRDFPEMRGFSKSNLYSMRVLALLYPDGIGQQSFDQLPWGHIIVLTRIKDAEERHWYIKQDIEHGWSKPMLVKQIQSDLYKRQALADGKVSNYLTRLPNEQSLLAQELLKNPYNFDCLGLHDEAQEREIEHASVQHITKFLLELGKGFAFIGSQVPIEVSGTEFFIDMLFYHVIAHCYFVIEIKATPFKPEHAGQLNFYLNAVDDKIKMPEDKPTIGLLLVKSRDKVIAEYALRGIEKPIGVSEYLLTKAIPEELKRSLPTIQEIELELNEVKIKKENKAV